jgi:hypothetical protein
MPRADVQVLATADQNYFQANDVLLAFKHIGLSDLLNGSEKQVAAFLVNSYNRKTGRCDPSLHTASVLLKKHERTIIRAVEKLVALGWVRKRRHGGHHHCNSYQPNWPVFRNLEQEFRERQREHSNRFDARRLSPLQCHSSPSECHPCHSEADKSDTQTSSSNNIQGTFPAATSPRRSPNHHRLSGNQVELGNEVGVTSTEDDAELRSSRLTRYGQLAHTAAIRRWNNDLLTLRSLPSFAGIVEAIDPELERAATEAELERKGTGLQRILHELSRRGVAGAAELAAESAPRQPTA